MSAFQTWFTTFNAEKGIPFACWVIAARDGSEHFMSTDVVKANIMSCSVAEQQRIKTTLMRIDFLGRDVNRYYKHLAQGLVDNF